MNLDDPSSEVVLSTTLIVGAGPAGAGLFFYARARGLLENLLTCVEEEAREEEEEEEKEKEKEQKTKQYKKKTKKKKKKKQKKGGETEQKNSSWWDEDEGIHYEDGNVEGETTIPSSSSSSKNFVHYKNIHAKDNGDEGSITKTVEEGKDGAAGGSSPPSSNIKPKRRALLWVSREQCNLFGGKFFLFFVILFFSKFSTIYLLDLYLYVLNLDSCIQY